MLFRSDLLGREPVPAPGSTPSGLEHFMSEVDLAMGSHQRPRRAAHANRPAATDQGVKVLPYSQRDTTPPPVNE